MSLERSPTGLTSLQSAPVFQQSTNVPSEGRDGQSRTPLLQADSFEHTLSSLAPETASIIRWEEIQGLQPLEDGEGAEGYVQRGKWHHADVAVKRYKNAIINWARANGNESNANENAQRDFQRRMREIQLVGRLSRHPNIVHFCGVCFDPLAVVTEYYPKGSLFQLVSNARNGRWQERESLSWTHRLRMLYEVAAGMQYLHTEGCVHGDLRSPNLFIDSHGHVKIGDFGFARVLNDSLSGVPQSRFTNPRWMAPERLDGDPLTFECDLYSFGVVMWEVLTWQEPYKELNDLQVINLVSRGDVRLVVPDSLPDTGVPLQQIYAYKKLMSACLHRNARSRPDFEQIARRLAALRHWETLRMRLRHVLRGLLSSRSRHSSAAYSTGPSRNGPVAQDGATDTTSAASGGTLSVSGAQDVERWLARAPPLHVPVGMGIGAGLTLPMPGDLSALLQGLGLGTGVVGAASVKAGPMQGLQDTLVSVGWLTGPCLSTKDLSGRAPVPELCHYGASAVPWAVKPLPLGDPPSLAASEDAAPTPASCGKTCWPCATPWCRQDEWGFALRTEGLDGEGHDRQGSSMSSTQGAKEGSTLSGSLEKTCCPWVLSAINEVEIAPEVETKLLKPQHMWYGIFGEKPAGWIARVRAH